MGNGVFHVMRDHQRGQPVLLHDAVRQVKHLGGRARVERGGVLVEKQQLRLLQRRHQERQRLPLAAGEQTDLRGHALLKAEIERMETFLVLGALRLCDAPFQAPVLPAAGGEGEVFFDLHGGRGAHHGILKHAAEKRGTLMLRQAGDVRAVNDDLAAVDLERARNGVQHSRLPCPVAADDSDEIAVVQGQIQVIQRRFGVDRTGVEGFADIDKLKHGAIPPFWLFHGTFFPSNTEWRGRARRSAP